MGLGNQLHGIQTFRLTLEDTWGGFRGHLGTLGVGLGDTWGHLGFYVDFRLNAMGYRPLV